jgi:hypothetical protein
MSSKIHNLSLPAGTTGEFVTNKEKGAGYHFQNDNLHTFTITFSNWTGELKFQGTLQLYPTTDNTDWVFLKDSNDNDIIIGDGSTDYDSSVIMNSEGKFVWIRAVGRTDSGEITEIRYVY